MPKPAKSTEIVKFLFSKASKYMQKTLVSMFFLYFTHMGMLLNFNTTTSFGRNMWHYNQSEGRKCGQKMTFWTAKGHVLEDKRIGFGG